MTFEKESLANMRKSLNLSCTITKENAEAFSKLATACIPQGETYKIKNVPVMLEAVTAEHLQGFGFDSQQVHLKKGKVKMDNPKCLKILDLWNDRRKKIYQEIYCRRN